MSFELVERFEKEVAKFFDAPYATAVIVVRMLLNCV